MQCKNNPSPQCISLTDHVPIPQGSWAWNVNGPGSANSKPNGRRLGPLPGTNVFNRDSFLTPQLCKSFWSVRECPVLLGGCITGSPADMQLLNQLLDAEDYNTLLVTD